MEAEVFWLWEKHVSFARVLQIWEKMKKEKYKLTVIWNLSSLLQFYNKTKQDEMTNSHSMPPLELICHWLMTVIMMLKNAHVKHPKD